MSTRPSALAILDEDRRLHRVKTIVRLTSSLIMQGGLTRGESERLVAAARGRILALFPGCEDTFELIYGYRFHRIIEEFASPD